ncbi:hypothetical protein NKI63_25920 [Mesorhizobium sp. M0410]|uniref:hypothetical protein n=1 Tax=Mesorhizobium sp. M0410 TaxID=2956943 RepID=UPI00333D1054
MDVAHSHPENKDGLSFAAHRASVLDPHSSAQRRRDMILARFNEIDSVTIPRLKADRLSVLATY